MKFIVFVSLGPSDLFIKKITLSPEFRSKYACTHLVTYIYFPPSVSLEAFVLSGKKFSNLVRCHAVSDTSGARLVFGFLIRYPPSNYVPAGVVVLFTLIYFANETRPPSVVDIFASAYRVDTQYTSPSFHCRRIVSVVLSFSNNFYV